MGCPAPCLSASLWNCAVKSSSFLGSKMLSWSRKNRRILILFLLLRAALTLQMPSTGTPRVRSPARCSASASWGASSVIRNSIRSAFRAASKAVFSSSSPPKAATPGTSIIFIPCHSYSRTSRVVRCWPFPMEFPSPSVSISFSVDLPVMVRPKRVMLKVPSRSRFAPISCRDSWWPEVMSSTAWVRRCWMNASPSWFSAAEPSRAARDSACSMMAPISRRCSDASRYPSSAALLQLSRACCRLLCLFLRRFWFSDLVASLRSSWLSSRSSRMPVAVIGSSPRGRRLRPLWRWRFPPG